MDDKDHGLRTNEVTELRQGRESPWHHLRCLTHELSTALTTMKIAGETLGSPEADELGFRQVYAALIAEECGLISRLMRDFAEVLRPHCDAVDNQGEKVDLTEAAHQAAMELSGLAAQLHCRILLVPTRRHIAVVGNRERVTQALRGFMEYLLGAVPAGTTVEVDVNAQKERGVAACVAFSAHYLKQEGLSSPRIVLDWTRINLAAARQIVELQGGEVWSEQEGDGGETPVLSAAWPNPEAIVDAASFGQYATWQASQVETVLDREAKAA